MEIAGQTTVFGQVVAERRLILPGLGEVDYLMPNDDDADLDWHDQIRVTLTYKIGKAVIGDDLNKQLVGKSPFGWAWKAVVEVPQCVQIDTVFRRDDAEKAWEQAHGATG